MPDKKQRTQEEIRKAAHAAVLKVKAGMEASQKRHARPAKASGNFMQKTQERRKAKPAVEAKKEPGTFDRLKKLLGMEDKKPALHKAGLTKQEIARFGTKKGK